MTDLKTSDLKCIHRAGCPKPEVCGKVGHCTSMMATDLLYADLPQEDALRLVNRSSNQQLIIISTGAWNDNKFRVCRGQEKIEGDYVADFVHREDAELFVKTKGGAAVSTVPRTRLRFTVELDGADDPVNADDIRYCIYDDDFGYDALMRINGDFWCAEAHREYVQAICDVLNEAQIPTPDTSKFPWLEKD